MNEVGEGQREGEIESIIRSFNRYEVENFAKCIAPDGLNWWCVVRYNVLHFMAIERGVYGSRTFKSPSTWQRLKNLTSNASHMCRDFFMLFTRGVGEAESIYVSTRNLGPIAEWISGETGKCLVVGSSAVPSGRHTKLEKQSVEFATRLLQRFVSVPDDVTRAAERLDTEIKREFGTKLDIRGLILGKYRQNQAAMMIWSFVLKCVKNPKRIVYLNDNLLKGLVHLARGRNIRTVEVQHAYMGCSHELFSYPPLPVPLTTLPHECVVTLDTGDITYPVPIIPWGQSGKKDRPAHVPAERHFDVMIGSVRGREKETVAMMMALSDAGFRIAVKLHPSQQFDQLQLTPESIPENVQIFAKNMSFVDLAWQSKVYISVHTASTTGFEAADCDVRVIVIDYDGRKLTEIMDRIACARVERIEELPDVVARELENM